MPAKNPKSLAMSVSYDGKRWTKVPVTKGKITDKKGNVSSMTVWNTYLGK